MVMRVKYFTISSFLTLALVSSNSFGFGLNNDDKIYIDDHYFETGESSAKVGYITQRGKYTKTRLEIEISYHESELNTSDRSSTTGVMTNVYYDFNLDKNSDVTPYVGLGAGFSRIELKADSSFDSQSIDTGMNPSYQLMAGISYNPGKISNSRVDFGYRYFSSAGDFDRTLSNLSDQYELDNHSVSVNFNILF